MESLHIIKGLWNLSNIGAENSDTRIRLERDSLGRAVKEWQDAHWDGVQCAGAETSRLVSGGVYSSWEY